MGRDERSPGPAAPDGRGPSVLREYALLADGHRGALVGPDGNVTWLCAPGWADPPVFSGLLGGRGDYLVTPANPRFVWGGHYEPGSLVWVSRWVTTDGIIESREALLFPGEERRVVLLRQIHAVDRDAVVHVRLDPRADFGREPVREVRREGPWWLARTGDLYLRHSGGERLRPTGDGPLCGELTIPDGGRHDLVLEIATHPLDAEPLRPDELWRTTEHTWRDSLPPLAGGPAQRDALFAYAVLRGLTRPGGGTVAAATTSLPERALAGHNYDYRYAWVRDQSFAGQAAALVGRHDLLDDAVAFLTQRVLADGDRLAPAYTVDGSPVPPQHGLEFLPGYPGGSPRIGNWVREQFQLDAFGEVLLLLAAAGRHDRLDDASWRAMELAVRTIGERWRQPDSGIWELPPRQWTHSKLMCVAGLRAAARVAPRGSAGRWVALADTILADVAAHGLHPSGRWQRAYDDGRVDAALLLPGIRGALPAGDPRTEATRQAVLAELERDGYLYRFRPDSRPLGDAEGAFLLCGFAAALAADQAGDVVAANRWFERNRAACGAPGLFTEEYDVEQRQLRGNFPQAFVHALMLETAVTLGQAEACPGSH
ncbi:Glucoamylase (glucan-1,4-alpha-glucosidase), GH15 family [Micromonospora viridifaciens]|uniref:Glucoamylase (Glucan-1,4-alpha-glucosidase), GH15 family n=1 Tax=Micromonospora viridifaciens TaxID=1881 RepID=A0A1C4XN01_MICVI|nr:glycoside hydrolase family 15 protein [Micromonospora viridifaciens]SCF09793.1 Glucoamylase (glucan-1,4-alpha-glucosidase), GH15 family [Micromonospora viridifaciens]